MASLRFSVIIVLLVCATAPAAERPFGLARRIPWNDSHVVGSPEPPLPYKSARAFARLTIKQPLSLAPEPGATRLFILQHLNNWAGPGRMLAVEDDQNATQIETLLELDGIPYGVAFHPDYQRNGYIYIGMNGTLRGKEKSTYVVR
jgi:hypothetical protein